MKIHRLADEISFRGLLLFVIVVAVSDVGYLVTTHNSKDGGLTGEIGVETKAGNAQQDVSSRHVFLVAVALPVMVVVVIFQS